MPTSPPFSFSFILPAWRPLITAFAPLHTHNPFDPTWEALQTAAWATALARSASSIPSAASAAADAYAPAPADAYAPRRPTAPPPHRERVITRLGQALTDCALLLGEGMSGPPADLALYQGAALYGLSEQFSLQLQALIDEDGVDVAFYDDFLSHHRLLFGHPGLTVPEPAHLLALLYQARRAWYFPTVKILGRSPSAAAARAAIWRANMGGDLCTYADGLYRRMDEIPVLITGATGTGKDLAAECIGGSAYIPFDPTARRFARRYADDFHARNLCEVSVELLESHLFGHRRGAFTGATADSPGYFGLAKRYGTLFLDEAGELPRNLQVKLLRPFENREYVPVGDVKPREIQGRLVFATNRDLEALCRAGDFRADLLERMNGVHIHMPSLRTMLDEAPDEIVHYVRAFVAAKVDDPARVERWTARVVQSIDATRPRDPWERNLRELKNYTERFLFMDARSSSPELTVPARPAVATAAPAPAPTPEPPPPAVTVAPSTPPAQPESTCLPSSGILGPKAKAGEVTLEEVNRALVTRVFVLTDQNKAETGRLLGVTWRTVARWLDLARLARWLMGKKK